MGSRAWWAIGVVVLLAGSGLRAQEDERNFTRVRAADETFRALIREGDARSATFRAIVDEIQASNAVVMVQFGLCANGRFRSCVSHIGGSATTRTIRILIKPQTTENRLIATIAHELHHALEIIRQPEITTPEQVRALYKRIGKDECAKGRSDRCETEAALAVEKRVLNELES